MTFIEEITSILSAVKKITSKENNPQKALKAARDKRYQTSSKGRYMIYKQRLRRRMRNKKLQIEELERSIYG